MAADAPNLADIAQDLERTMSGLQPVAEPKPKPPPPPPPAPKPRKPRTKAADKASIRAAFREELGDDIGVKMAQSIEAALESTKTEWVKCIHCHSKTPWVLPNAFERAKACQLVIEQLEGKVGTHRDPPAKAAVKVGDLSEMSDDDLLALLQAPTDEESDESGD